MGRPTHDLTGMKFGKLTAISIHSRGHHTEWLCGCDCGNTHVVKAYYLRCGDVKSCGCLPKETNGASQRTHGMSKTKMYRLFMSMHARCENTNNHAYADYGGRGISVSPQWKKFEPFYAWAMENGFQPGLTLDREKNDGNYGPDNFRWVSYRVQARNRRSSRYIEVAGARRLLVEVAEESGIPARLLHARIFKRKWPIERAISEPIGASRRKASEVPNTKPCFFNLK